MVSEADETTSTTAYELACTDCAFETTVEGSVYDAIDVANEHREANEEPFTEHFVEFELRTASTGGG